MSTTIRKSQLVEGGVVEEDMVTARPEAFDDLFRTVQNEDVDNETEDEGFLDSFDEDVIREAEEEVMLDELTETEEIDLSLF